MIEQAEDSAVEARLRDFLAAELHRAELDYPRIAIVRASGRRSRRPLVLTTIAVCVIAAVILVRPLAAPPASSTGGVPVPSSRGPSTGPTSQGCRSALAAGTLVADGGTLALRGVTGETFAIEWPSGYSVRREGDLLVLLDSLRGSLRALEARLGDFVQVGGDVGNDGVFHACGDVTVITPSGIASPEPGTTIDGFKLGVVLVCSPAVGSVDPSLTGSTCAGQLALATAALDARDPGHAAVVDVARYSDGTQPEPLDVSGNAPTPTPPPTMHPGPRVTVFVFTLADGSVRATGVACPDARSCVGVGSYPN